MTPETCENGYGEVSSSVAALREWLVLRGTSNRWRAECATVRRGVRHLLLPIYQESYLDDVLAQKDHSALYSLLAPDLTFLNVLASKVM